MSSDKFELNSEGVRELLKSQEMMDVCAEHANKVISQCGNGFETSSHIGKNRVNVSVYPVTKSAKNRNYKENVLLKALR